MVKPFVTKRRLKFSMKVMLILCVSFFVLISCGIPSYFYMSNNKSGTTSSYYNFTSGESDSTYADTFDLDFAVTLSGDTNSLVTSIEGPSLVFLYAFVPDDFTDSQISSVTTKFKSAFKTDYINSNTGRPISSSTDVVLNIEYDSENYNMYKFNLYNLDSLINNQSPNFYGLKYNGSTYDGTEVNSSFGFLYKTNTDGTYTISLDQTDANNNFYATDSSSLSDGIILRPYNYKSKGDFTIVWDEMDSDYESIDDSDNYKLVVYSALNVSEGDGFTNIFWGSLQEVATILTSSSSSI